MLIVNVLLALVWVALTGQFTPLDFAIGFMLGYLLLWREQSNAVGSSYFFKARQVLGFLGFVAYELVSANVQVALDVLRPPNRIQRRPGVVAIPLDARTDMEITLLSNLITLTPGSLSLDVSDDRRVLYMHTMYLGDDPDQLREEIKSKFERRVLEVLR